MYDRTTVQGATFNMRGQLYRGHTNATVVQWSVHWAPSRTTWVLVLARTRHCALVTCGKKMRAPLLGSAKSIYYYLFLIHKLLPYQENRIKSPYIKKWK